MTSPFCLVLPSKDNPKQTKAQIKSKQNKPKLKAK